MLSIHKQYQYFIQPIIRNRHSFVGNQSFLSIKITQHYQNGDKIDYRTLDDKKSTSIPIKTSSLMLKDQISIVLHIKRQISKTIHQLLPFGYPNSVKSGYSRFVFGQFIANTLGTICGVLSMQSLFQAVGIGASTAAPFAAALNWIIKDGLGQFGGVLFASVTNNKFDTDPKRWRFLAAFSLECARFIEMLAPLAPSYFLLIASIANVGENISYLAASSSRAAIHKNFALHENMGDVTAKTGSQSIIASLLGTGIGISAASNFSGQFSLNFLFFIVCSWSSLVATYFSLNHVVISTFTITKLDMILESYFMNDIIMSPTQVMKKEVFLGAPWSHVPQLHIGSDITVAIPDAHDLEILLNEVFKDEKYVINILTTNSKSDEKVFAEVHLLFKSGAQKKDLIFGLIHAYIARMLMADYGFKSSPWNLFSSTRFRGSNSKIQYVIQSQRILHGQEVSSKIQLSENEAHDLCHQLIGHNEWLIEEMHLELRHARIEVN